MFWRISGWSWQQSLCWRFYFWSFIFGKEINGAKGWIQIAGFTIQPAEYLKIIAIWYLSWTLSKRQYSIQKDFIGTVKRPLALVLVLTAIVAILPDFGNATVIFLITLVLLLASGINYVYTLIVGFGGVGLSVFTIWLVNITHGKFLPERLQYIYNRFCYFSESFFRWTQ